jgi:LmbE family N-acetylglucosaminyl deacetylase
MLPAWPSVLVVIAHPDDESFGLGAVIDKITSAGAAVHIVCFTHGGASTLNQMHTDLHRVRETELHRAAPNSGRPVSRCWITPTAAWPATSPTAPPAPAPSACSSSTTPG